MQFKSKAQQRFMAATKKDRAAKPPTIRAPLPDRVGQSPTAPKMASTLSDYLEGRRKKVTI